MEKVLIVILLLSAFTILSFPVATFSGVKPKIIVFLTTTGGGTQWTVPSNFESLISVDAIGAGAGGARGSSNTSAGGGGGGAAFSQSSDWQFLSRGQNIDYVVGTGGSGATAAGAAPTSGGDTIFGATSYANCLTASAAACVAAKGGTAPASVTDANGGAGGLASLSIGELKYSGGAGGVGVSGAGGGGGGSAGPGGAGGDGSGSGGGSGDGGTVPGNSGNGTDYVQTSDSSVAGGSGGANGCVTNGCTGGTGLNYGSGGGGGTRATGAGGNGGPGFIAVIYYALDTTPNRKMLLFGNYQVKIISGKMLFQ